MRAANVGPFFDDVNVISGIHALPLTFHYTYLHF